MVPLTTRPASAPLRYQAHAIPATYSLSLHDALPISTDRLGVHLHHEVGGAVDRFGRVRRPQDDQRGRVDGAAEDRKSTRLNSSHGYISYAVFCVKKKTRGATEHSLPRDEGVAER